MPSKTATLTLLDAVNAAYDVLKETSDASNYPVSLMRSYVRTEQAKVCDGSVESFDPKATPLQKPQLVFLDGRKVYSTVKSGLVATSPAAGATVLEVGDATPYLASGAVWLEGEVVTYSGKTSTQLTGCLPIGFPYAVNTVVRQLFPLPADFSTATRLTYDGRTTCRPVDQRDIIANMNVSGAFLNRNAFDRDEASERLYAIISGEWLLPHPQDAAGKSLLLEYQRVCGPLAEDSDVLTIPDDYSLEALSLLAASKMLAMRRELDDAMHLRQLGLNAVQSMYRAWNYASKETAYNQRMRTAQDSRGPNLF